MNNVLLIYIYIYSVRGSSSTFKWGHDLVNFHGPKWLWVEFAEMIMSQNDLEPGDFGCWFSAFKRPYDWNACNFRYH